MRPIRRIILDVAVTLDWLVTDKSIDFGDILKNILIDIDAIFYRRISYELWGSCQTEEKQSS